MSDYQLIITVTSAQLPAVLPDLAKYEPRIRCTESLSSGEKPKHTRSAGKVSPTDYICVGLKQPTGGQALKAVELLEKLELKHGAHRVTRRMLTTEWKRLKLADSFCKSGLSAAIKTGYIRKS
jgi:hypothetical protein